MIRRTSWPRSSSAAACSSACSTTAPQNDHENGTTIPIFTRGSLTVASVRWVPMMLDGIHHVTCITGDAPRNVDFYTRVLGLRLVKKTVNQDDPTVYHLFYADEAGTPGSDITFFEYPGVRRGRAGAGMVHTVQWRVGSEAALDFWERRLAAEADARRARRRRLAFDDPEGLRHRLVVVDGRRRAARSRSIRRFRPSTRCRDSTPSARSPPIPEASRALLEETLGFVSAGDDAWEARGPTRGGLYAYDEPPAERGLGGAGTVHHVAWSSSIEEHEAWHARVAAAGMHPSPIIDRFWFRSIYFREPSGVLFEIATLGPGFSRGRGSPSTWASRSSSRPPSSTCASRSSRS